MPMIQLDDQQIGVQCFPVVAIEHFILTINSVSSYIKTIQFIFQETKNQRILS